MSPQRIEPATVRAFLFAIPIGVLGGMIGLGGAEFRLPVLVGALGYTAAQAVPLNLAVSIFTLVAALATRARVLSLEPIRPLVPVMLGLVVAAVATAGVGASLVTRLTREGLERLILALLVGIGLLLMIEGVLPEAFPPLVGGTSPWRAAAAVPFGLGIGFVSSMLGVAGGELIIPTLVFVFGADIKAAGTASLMVSLPTVLVGVMRYASLGRYADRAAWMQTVLPMGVGSVIGAALGAWAAGVVSASILKFGLGAILIASAYRIFRHVSARGVK